MIEWAKKMNPTRVNVAQLQAYPNCPITDTLNTYKDIPNKHLMSFNEMEEWEKFCFKEFYIKNPHFWLQVITSPRELKSVLKDAFGMLKFLSKKE
jgi:hypothetical protein